MDADELLDDGVRGYTYGDLTGRRFGSWLVLGFAGRRAKQAKSHYYFWECRCTECNRVAIILGLNLINGLSKRCKSCSQRHASVLRNSRRHIRPRESVEDVLADYDSYLEVTDAD